MHLTIPEKYRDSLELIEPTDLRTDEEILATFSEYKPVTGEKNVWAYWHAGVQNMPNWNKRNVADWVRLLGPEWTVRVVDNLPGSVNNVLQYVSKDLFPSAFVSNTMDGQFVGQHGSDLSRTACLYEYGGVYMDVGSLLIQHLDRVCWNEIGDSNSPYRVALPMVWPLLAGNYFIAAQKKDPFIYSWHRLLLHLWGDSTRMEGGVNHPLIELIAPTVFEHMDPKFNLDWNDINLSVVYASQMACATRLFCLEENDEGFSGVDYYRNHILALSGELDFARAEYARGMPGFGPFALGVLTLPYSGPDADPTSEKYKDAEDMIWDLLANATMWKIYHAKNLTLTPHLGILLDLPENEGKDALPGSFGELLRYGTLHLRQTRERSARPEKVEPSQTWKKGIIEP
ncbi:hypothetical protein N7478_008202 [Penicillium angulare]|uniref:uncharacterized protein n=1 Tax=Penicillium angulare TaxID=116970 RepID=UPI002541F5C7|nr:uncharacterized protein N7478_008202 [Penicillium angulare]KAJ5273077.1 hypothetical protein N7478_008202 [Penicillium angulare]